MKPRPTDAQYSAFAAAFDYFNRALFSGQLPQPMLTFSRRRMTYGLFVPGLWTGEDEAPVHEIALNPDQLASRTDLEVASTLVHEMCHEYHFITGNPGRRGYHNAEFARIMEERGLWTTSDGTWEGKRTGQRITHKVMPGGKFEHAFTVMPRVVLLPFTCRASLETGGTQKSRSKIAYVCLGTSQKFWGAPGIVAIDAHSGEPFVRADRPEETCAAFDPVFLAFVKVVAELGTDGRAKLLDRLGDLASPGQLD